MNWLKSLPIWITFGAVLTAIILVLNGRKTSRLLSRAKSAEVRADILLNSEIESNIRKGKRLADKAVADKQRAKAAKQQTKTRLQQLGNADATIDSAMSGFNSRVRRRSR